MLKTITPPVQTAEPRLTAPAMRPLARGLSALSLALAAALGPALPTTALAQTHWSERAELGVSGFGVTPVDRLRPGEVLAFRIDGTPGARARVQINGASAPLLLSEVSPGRYEGEYTIRQRDRLSASSVATARLEKNGRSVSATLAQSLLAGAAPVAGVQIDAFDVNAPARVRPGDELVFTLRGQAGGDASVSVAGIARRIPLSEVRPGVYEGTYVVRRNERVPSPLSADARLRVDRRDATLRYDAAASTGQTGSPAAVCTNCGAVTQVRRVTVDSDQPNVLGTIAGGVIGGVLGNQVGGGSGRDLATIAGAVGGAYAGNRIENNRNKREVHRVSVKLDNGTTRSFDYADDPGLKPGARVRVVNNALERA